MAKLVLNARDLTEKHFSLTCGLCGSARVTIDIDWTLQPFPKWLYVDVGCEDCEHVERIYEAD